MFLVKGFMGPGGMYMWLIAILFVIGIVYGIKNIRALWSEATAQQTAQKNRDKKFLLVMGNFTAVLGGLGTIIGIIVSLEALPRVAKAHQLTALRAGFTASLTASAWGLMAAIGCWALHVLIKSKEKKVLG